MIAPNASSFFGDGDDSDGSGVLTMMELLMVELEIVVAKWLKWPCWLDGGCLGYIPHCSDKSNLREEGFVLPYNFSMQFLQGRDILVTKACGSWSFALFLLLG